MVCRCWGGARWRRNGRARAHTQRARSKAQHISSRTPVHSYKSLARLLFRRRRCSIAHKGPFLAPQRRCLQHQQQRSTSGLFWRQVGPASCLACGSNGTRDLAKLYTGQARPCGRAAGAPAGRRFQGSPIITHSSCSRSLSSSPLSAPPHTQQACGGRESATTAGAARYD